MNLGRAQSSARPISDMVKIDRLHRHESATSPCSGDVVVIIALAPAKPLVSCRVPRNMVGGGDATVTLVETRLMIFSERSAFRSAGVFRELPFDNGAERAVLLGKFTHNDASILNCVMQERTDDNFRLPHDLLCDQDRHFDQVALGCKGFSLGSGKGLCYKPCNEVQERDRRSCRRGYAASSSICSVTNCIVSARTQGPIPKARSTMRASPRMSRVRLKIDACPLRSARITSKPLIVA